MYGVIRHLRQSGFASIAFPCRRWSRTTRRWRRTPWPRLARSSRTCAMLAAIELLAAAQAVDLRGAAGEALGAERSARPAPAVRARVPHARRRSPARARTSRPSARVHRRRRLPAGRSARAMKWLRNNWDQVLVALGEHIVISFTSLAIAFALSLAIGIWAARNDRVFRWSLAISGFLYTIPTLAFLALLIPVVGLGRTNAIICMVAFSLMIMIRNVATGIREVPARRGRCGARHGHEPIEILTRIELPLALPVIVAGTAHRNGHRDQRRRGRGLRQRRRPGNADLQRHQQRLCAARSGPAR